MSAPGPSERRACRFRRASAAAGFVIFSAMGAFAATLLPPLSGAEVHGSNPLVVELKLDGEVEPILAAYIDEGLADEIGRASCRERACVWGAEGARKSTTS